MNPSDLHSHTGNSSTTTTSSGGGGNNGTSSTSSSGYASTKPGLLSNSNSGGSVCTTTSGATGNQAFINTRFDFVILSKLDKDGNLNLLHSKPLSVEILNQVPDSVILFSEGL